jgi:hypothetical protein
MASFAKLDSSNKVVQVVAVNNNVITDSNGIEQENLGIEFLRNLYNQPEVNWKKTSYNTKAGKYYDLTNNILLQDQSKAFRKNYASIGYIYDESRDAFIAPQPYNSWILNEQSCCWESPSPRPEAVDGKAPIWDENSLSWIFL